MFEQEEEEMVVDENEKFNEREYEGREQQTLGNDLDDNFIVRFPPVNTVNEIVDGGGIGFPLEQFFQYCYYDEKQPSENYATCNNPFYYMEPDQCLIKGPVYNYLPIGRARINQGGASNCDRSYCPGPNDYISTKFFNDHICVYQGRLPSNLAPFCSDFRPSQPKYQVMILNTKELGVLRSDIKAHQQLYYDNRAGFPPIRPPPSTVHFFTTSTYSFVDCTFSSGKWKGKLLSNSYQAYIPRGTAGNPRGLYQIYHGCPPVKDRPGDSAPGNC